MQVSVHVLGRRGPEAAAACLRPLRASLPRDVRLRFLDDGARDGSPEAVAAAFPDVDVWSFSYAGGFAGAHNRGLRRAFSGAGDDAVLVLSEDARPEPGFLPPLIEVMKWRPRAGLVSPKIRLPGEPSRLWYAGGQVDWWRGLAIQRGAGERDDGRFDRPGPTDFASAVAVLVRSQAFDRAGPMDESFSSGLHDVDWSARTLRVGMEVHYQPLSQVVYQAPGAAAVGPSTDLAGAAPPFLASELSRRPSARNRLRLVVHHGRWYHWSTTGARVAAEATGQLLRGLRRREPHATDRS